MILIDKHTIDYLEEFMQEARNQIEIENINEIINDYKKQNQIDDLTEEEFIDIFQESVLYPYHYLPVLNDASYYGILVSDYEFYQLNRGIGLGHDRALMMFRKYKDYIRQTVDGYDLGDAESISYGEYEKLLSEDLEYYESVKTETIEVRAKDINDVLNLLNGNWDETAYRIRIHYCAGENKFLIIGYDESTFHYYKVCLETYDKKGDSGLFVGSSTNPNSIKKIIELYIEMGPSINLCFGLSSSVNMIAENNVNSEIISEGRINLIMDLANQRYYEGKINMPVEQALMVMLSITHFFKFSNDYQKEWYNKHNSRMEKELEEFKKKEGINDWKSEMEWIHKNGAMRYHISIPDLLLQTLFTLNGSYYRINDRDYEWEEEFYKIFVDMPFGREFDMAMLDFLLLPLYNCEHGTNYKIQYCMPINNNGCTQES